LIITLNGVVDQTRNALVMVETLDAELAEGLCGCAADHVM
jgi:hypothetical protein